MLFGVLVRNVARLSSTVIRLAPHSRVQFGEPEDDVVLAISEALSWPGCVVTPARVWPISPGEVRHSIPTTHEIGIGSNRINK